MKRFKFALLILTLSLPLLGNDCDGTVETPQGSIYYELQNPDSNGVSYRITESQGVRVITAQPSDEEKEQEYQMWLKRMTEVKDTTNVWGD
jgi:hypothetical protein